MPFFLKKTKKKAIQKSWQRKSAAVVLTATGKAEKRKPRKFSRFLFWLLLAAFWGVCAYLLLFSPFLDIEKISVEGNRDIASEDIAKVAEKSLEEKYLGFWPRKNFFLISKKNISGAIEKNFKYLEVKSIERKFPETILIKLIERKAELIWCSAGVCYFVEESGFVYGGAPESEEELRNQGFLVVVDDSAIPVEIGKTKINPEYVKFIEEVNGMIRNDLESGVAESYHTSGAASGEVSVKTKEGWILKISLEYSVEKTKKIIQAIFEKELDGEKRKNLEYLDLRVKEKAYYKLR